MIDYFDSGVIWAGARYPAVPHTLMIIFRYWLAGVNVFVINLKRIVKCLIEGNNL
jgi:hypothetical protein